MHSLSLTEIARATNGELIGEDLAITSISTNSNEISESALFVPIIGERFDGHSFIGGALQNGAAAFLSDRKTDFPAPYVLVKNTRAALGDLAKYYLGLFKIPVVAVTGSSGKTSVKGGIAKVLSCKYSVLSTEGNLNNDIGLPLTVFNLDNNCEIAVFEMGMNSFGEIGYLSRLAKPDFGVITNIGTAHIEKLGSRDGILRAKLELAEGMDENGVLVLNYDDDLLRIAGKSISRKILWVSAEEQIGVHAKNINRAPGRTSFTICYEGREIDTHIHIGETPLILNALMSAAVGFLLGLSDEQIKEGVLLFASEKGRLEECEASSGAVILNDCYNANTDSMKLALDVLSRLNCEKIAILGDMFEQGDYAREFHLEIGEYAYKSNVDVLIAIGDKGKYYKEGFDALNRDERKSYYFQSKEELYTSDLNLGGNKTILLKASRGMKFEDILKYLLEYGERHGS